MWEYEWDAKERNRNRSERERDRGRGEVEHLQLTDFATFGSVQARYKNAAMTSWYRTTAPRGKSEWLPADGCIGLCGDSILPSVIGDLNHRRC